MDDLNADGLSLLEFIERVGGTLEWRKCQKKHPQVWDGQKFVVDNDFNFPPYLSFRFEVEIPEFIEDLKNMVESFCGHVEWVMLPHNRGRLSGVNWTIQPKLAHEAELCLGTAAGDTIKKIKPGFISSAFDDYPDFMNCLRELESRKKYL